MLFALAILGALVTGWVPAMAATFDAGRGAGEHHMHAAAGKTGHDGTEREHGRGALHPAACAACFAIPAAAFEGRGIIESRPAYADGGERRFAGTVPLPLDPPPRS